MTDEPTHVLGLADAFAPTDEPTHVLGLADAFAPILEGQRRRMALGAEIGL